MIIDFITRTNNMSYNVKLAKLFGLYSSVYLNLLIDCHFQKDDEYIKLSRDDIYNLTGIAEEMQEEAEKNLISYNLIEVSKLRNSSSKNYYKLNTDLLTKILTSSSDEIEEELSKTVEAFKRATKPPKSVSKRACVIINLKKAIKTTDSVARAALEDWIDAIYKKLGYLAKAGVEYMEDELSKASNKKITVFRELCKTAARVVYKEPKWVLVKYEEANGKSSLILNNVSQDDIDDNLKQLKNYNGETF